MIHEHKELLESVRWISRFLGEELQACLATGLIPPTIDISVSGGSVDIQLDWDHEWDHIKAVAGGDEGSWIFTLKPDGRAAIVDEEHMDFDDIAASLRAYDEEHFFRKDGDA